MTDTLEIIAEDTLLEFEIQQSQLLLVDQPTEVITQVDAFELSVVEESTIIEIADSRGPRGPSGDGLLTFAFDYNSITILPLLTVPANKVVLRVEICITTAFVGTGAALSIGDSGNHSRLMSSSEVDPTSISTYTDYPGISYSVGTDINLYITPGSNASAGHGVVSIILQQ